LGLELALQYLGLKLFLGFVLPLSDPIAGYVSSWFAETRNGW
jgi:hypothetical protein